MVIKEDAKLAVYLAERREDEDNGLLFHTFLILVDETRHPVAVLQQLHFNDDWDASLIPNVRKGSSGPERFSDVKVFELLGGKAVDILDVWNWALQCAFTLKADKMYFKGDYTKSDDAVNCRSAILAVMQAMGLDMGKPELIKHCFGRNSGLYCNDFPVWTRFEFDGKPEKSFLGVLETNQAMCAAMPADWIQGERYCGPVSKPMPRMGS